MKSFCGQFAEVESCNYKLNVNIERLFVCDNDIVYVNIIFMVFIDTFWWPIQKVLWMTKIKERQAET